jgi:hypothetical protein
MLAPPVRIVAGVVGTVWFLFSMARINRASEQVKLWNIPPYQKPAEQRAKAYQEPFLSFYVHTLQVTPSQTILHPNEVEYFYHKYLTNFCENLLKEKPSSDQEKQAWMAKFLTLNPLSPDMMQYGWKNIPPAFKKLNEAYSVLPAPVTYSMLRSKFAAFTFLIGPIGPIGRTGIYSSSSYLFGLEGLVVEYEKKLEALKNEYLLKRETLKSNYGNRLEKFVTESLPLKFQTLDNQFEHDLKTLKDPYIAETTQLRTAYLESLKKLKSQFVDHGPHSLEERLEKRWNELQTIFIENKNLIDREGQYEKARNLLERVTKELKPSNEEIESQYPRDDLYFSLFS